ncbi:efflux RND transporter permease subunit, partial [Neptunomonas phycophila]
PALCAIILKPNPKPMRWATWFNLKLENLRQGYIRLIQKTLNLKWVILTIFVALIAVFSLIYRALPTSFIPSEDQGML